MSNYLLTYPIRLGSRDVFQPLGFRASGQHTHEQLRATSTSRLPGEQSELQPLYAVHPRDPWARSSRRNKKAAVRLDCGFDFES